MARADSTAPLVLVCGDDEFAVRQRARHLFQSWSAAAGGFDHELIDASSANGGEALAALAKLREALQTLPFFGGSKVVWFQNCNFLGDERTAGTQAVTAALSGLSQELKEFRWENVRLLISAGKVDKRKAFYKTIEKIGTVEVFAGWSADDKDWAAQAEQMARRELKSYGKTASPEALSKAVVCVGPNARQLSSEMQKLSLYLGERVEAAVQDVDAIVTRNKQSRAFALADALGARDLPRLLKTLDQELWETQRDSQKSEIGLLYGLISKVRVMLFLKEMMREGWLKMELDYNRFKAQLDQIPTEALPEDRRFNPLAANPYVLFKAMGHAKQYTSAELVRAMEVLLDCNQQLIFSGLEEALVLQQALVKIVSRTA
jgi:DNA polymerase III subunit delta